ncbi:MAG: MBG domain-containing protein [Candidatus Acidiferrum sp.]
MFATRLLHLLYATSLTKIRTFFRVHQGRELHSLVHFAKGPGICGSLILLAAFSAAPVSASTLTVTNINDSGPGSLRDAIANAASGDTINFSTAGTITLASTLTINTSLTITGAGASNVAVSGNNAVQVLSIGPGVTVNLFSLTIQNGLNVGGGTYGSVAGGGIYNAGTLTLSNSTVSGNTVSATGNGYYVSVYGGGIYNAGTLTLINSTISGNIANGGGNDYYGAVTGGGLYNAGTLRLSNSTISGNSTISANDFFGSTTGAGISNGGTLTAKNSIVANNPSGGNCAGTIISQGYNLSDDATCAASFTHTGDLNSTPAGLDPIGLKTNGGSTQTIALLSTSPAVDAIPLSPINYCTDASGNAVTTDQRGVTRPQGAACDIGAFELTQVQTSTLAQTISFTTAAPAIATYNSTFPVAAQSTSGLTVTLSLGSGSTSVCSLGTAGVAGGVTSATVTMLSGTGTCTVFAIQLGDATFNAAALQQTSATAQAIGQTILFTQEAPSNASYRSLFTVAAQSSSGLTVALSVDASSTSVCSLGTPSVASGVTSAIVTVLSATGTCTIDADQPGNNNYSAATQQQTSAAIAALSSSIGDVAVDVGNSTITKLKAADGTALWSTSVTNDGAIAVDQFDFGVYTGYGSHSFSSPGTVYKLDSSGAQIWSNSISVTGGCNFYYVNNVAVDTTSAAPGVVWTEGGCYGAIAKSSRTNGAQQWAVSTSDIGRASIDSSTGQIYAITNAGPSYSYNTLYRASAAGSLTSASSCEGYTDLNPGDGTLYRGGNMASNGCGLTLSQMNKGSLGTTNWSMSLSTYIASFDALAVQPWSGGYIFVASVSSSEIVVVDPATQTVVRTFTTAVTPNNIAVNPSGGNVYVTNNSSHFVYAYSPTGSLVWTSPDLGGPAYSIAAPRGVVGNPPMANQTISFTATAPANASYNSTFTVGAQSDSGLTVTLSVDGGSTGVCSLGTPSLASGVTSATVTMSSGTGTCTIDANQAGDINYNAAAQQQTLATATLASQTISFTTTAPSTASYGSTFPMAAQSTSGLSVSLTVDAISTGVCSLGTTSVAGGVTSATVTISSSTGTCTIDANQAGNSNYNAAAQQQTSATAVLASQSISFTTTAPSTASYGSTFLVAAQSTSGLTVSLTVDAVSTGVCSLGSSIVAGGVTSAAATMLSANGVCTIDANQAGDGNYSVAAQQQTSATATKSDASTYVTSSLNAASYGQSVTLTATVTAVPPATGTSSGGTLTFMDGATVLGTGSPLTLSSLPGSAQGWSSITTSGTAPGSLCNLPILGDGQGDLIFYGQPACSGANQLWVLSNANGLGGTPTWTQLSPTGGTPPGRHAAMSVYDPTTNSMIIFGGCLSGCTPAGNDVWVLSHANGKGGTPVWTQLAPSGAAPNPRINSSAAYDPATNRLMIFAGQNGGGSACSTYSDTWVLTNANGTGGAPAWIQLSPTGGPPAGQYGPTTFYDSANNRMTVTGGSGIVGGSCSPTNAVWVLSNANGFGGAPVWTNLIPQGAAGAPANFGGVATGVYDAVNNRGLLQSQSPTNTVWAIINVNGLGGPAAWANLNPSGGPATTGIYGVVLDSTNNLLSSLHGDNSVWVMGTGVDPITAIYSGDSNFNATGADAGSTATPLPQTVNQVSQTISFTTTAPSTASYSSMFPVAAQSTSGLTVTLSVDAVSSGVCSLGTSSVASGVTSATVTMLSASGICSIDANQSGDGNYSVATQQQTSATAVPAGQTISFTTTAPSSASYSSMFPVAAQSTSGLTVSLSVDAVSTGVCSLGTSSVAAGVTSATVTMLSASGICTIDANQSGNANYSAATQQQTSATAILATQALLTVTGPASVTYGTTGTAAATGGSGTGAVSFSAGASTGCSVIGTTVSVSNAAGTCSLTATKAADSNYSAATSAAFPVTLVPASQALMTVTGPASVTYGTTGTAAATGGSGTGVLSFSAGASTGCSVIGTTVSVSNAAGTCSLTATKAADSNYSATTSAAFPVTLVKASATLTLSNLSQTYDGTPKSVTVTTNPNGLTGVSVTYTGTGGTAYGPTATAPTAAGSYAVDASLTNSNYQASDAVGTLTITAPTLVSIQITPANPSILLGLTQQFTATGTYSDNSTQNITASVTWTSATPSVATIGANTGLATGASAGTSQITGILGSVKSASMTLTVDNPAPSIGNLSPLHSPAGTAFTLTVRGSGFVSTSTVSFNGKKEATTFSSGTQLMVAIPATDISSGGAVSVTVTNPAPGGSTSTASSFTIDDFGVAGPGSTVYVIPGQPTPITISIAPTIDGFADAILLGVSGLPRGTTAQFSQDPVTPGTTTTRVTLIVTAAAAAALPPVPTRKNFPAGPTGLLAAILAAGLLFVRRRMPSAALLPARAAALALWLIVIGGLAASLGGCVSVPATGNSNATPPGNYTITVTGMSGTAQHSSTVTLSVE